MKTTKDCKMTPQTTYDCEMKHTPFFVCAPVFMCFKLVSSRCEGEVRIRIGRQDSPVGYAYLAYWAYIEGEVLSLVPLKESLLGAQIGNENRKNELLQPAIPH